MKARARTLVVAFAVSVSAAGCTKEKSGASSSPAAPVLVLTPSATSVVANGTNTVSIGVMDTGGAPVSLTISPSNRGTFSPGGGTTATVSGGVGTVTLVTCNAAVAGCTGAATVTATSSSGVATTSITFGSLAAVCPTNCSADPGCQNQTCTLSGGGSGTCSTSPVSTCVAAPSCVASPAGASTETSCSDGLDNDCNGTKDCADSACDGQACGGGATFFCKASKCTDVTSGLAVTVTPVRTRLPANGTTTTVVEVEVTADAEAASSMSVSISTNLGSFVAPTTGATGSDGKVRFTFTTSAVAGVATITAQLTALPAVKGTATITIPRLGALAIVEDAPGSAQYEVMGVKGSAWNEYGWIQVKAIDDLGDPYPDGLAIRFEHKPLGGSTFAPPLVVSPACASFTGCVAFDGIVSSGAEVDKTGLANAWVYTGTLSGTLAFTATATAGGLTRTTALPTVAVVGAKASGANFAIVCSPRNLPALAETDCAISLVDAPFTCEAILKDRFNNVLGRDTQVLFVSEAAAVGLVATSPAYDPKSGGAGQMDLGLAVQGFNPLGSGLPFDVDPLTTLGEPSVSHGVDGCGPRTHNPRDGLVTIVAIADGEEAFWDANGDGSYVLGEPFVDQGEPFVDQNDSGAYEPGEWFLDVDGNGAWTPPNGKWDAATKIWTQTVVVYTGEARTLVSGGKLLGTRFAGPDFVDPCLATAIAPSFDVDHATTAAPATTEAYVVVASDMNLNFLDTGTTYGTTIVPDDAPIKVFYSGVAAYTDWLGVSYRYWPCDKTGACASQCRATGAAAPCTMVPSITNYSCGLAAGVSITGGEKAGSGAVEWNVAVPWTVYGAIGRISKGGATLSGIVR